MHNREHVVLIRPADNGLVLHTLFYEDELHAANKTNAPKVKFSANELDMAKSLVKQLTAPFKPDEFNDTYRDNVERLIEQKRKGQKMTIVKQPKKAPVIDLMEALKESLKSAPSSRAGKKRSARSKAA
jgi:DNA end-binding protein Ku